MSSVRHWTRPLRFPAAALAGAASCLAVGGHREEGIALRATEHDGWPAALYLPVERDGRAALLHLDCASATTIVFLPGDGGWVEGAAELVVAGRRRAVPGYGGLGTLADVDGLPVIGMAGADLLLEAPVVIDVLARRWIEGPRAAAAFTGTTEVPYDLVQGVLVVRAEIDGEPVRLLVDTGSAHSLLLGRAPLPGDRLIVTEDALGGELRVHEGRARLVLGGEMREVPLLRAPSFPVLETLAARLGPDAAGAEVGGLLGLSSMAALHVDGTREVLRVVLPRE